MARKKRRGRPPGSKNKPKVTGSAGSMDIAQLSSHIESLRKMLAAKIEQQRAFFERQLAGLSGYTNGNGRRTAGSGGARVGRPRVGLRKRYESSRREPRSWRPFRSGRSEHPHGHYRGDESK